MRTTNCPPLVCGRKARSSAKMLEWILKRQMVQEYLLSEILPGQRKLNNYLHKGSLLRLTTTKSAVASIDIVEKTFFLGGANQDTGVQKIKLGINLGLGIYHMGLFEE